MTYFQEMSKITETGLAISEMCDLNGRLSSFNTIVDGIVKISIWIFDLKINADILFCVTSTQVLASHQLTVSETSSRHYESSPVDSE